MPVMKVAAKRKPYRAFVNFQGGRVQLGMFLEEESAMLAVAIAREILEPEQMMVAKFNNPALRAAVELRIEAYLASGARKFSEPL